MTLDAPSAPADLGSAAVEADITITHTRTEGTLLDAGYRLPNNAVDAITGDGLRFRWSSTIDCWYIPHSRYKRHDKRAVDLAAERLRALGHTVSVDIDDLSPSPPFAQREADRAEAAETRAERYIGYRDSAARRAELASATADRLFGDSFGQPILVGHYSEKAQRGRLKRAWNLEFKGAEERAKTAYWEHRAKASASWSDKRYNPGVTLRRIEKLSAEARRLTRDLEALLSKRDIADAYTLARMVDLEQVHEEIGFWNAHIDALKAQGVQIPGKPDIPDGAFIAVVPLGGQLRWHEVIRVNAKSVTVPNPYQAPGLIVRKPAKRGPQMAVPYNEICGVATAEQLRERYGDVL